MVLLIRKTIEAIHYYFIDYSDPRSDAWWTVNTPLPVFFMTIAYVYFSLWLGPQLMRNRKPFVLTGPIACYNVCQVIANAWLCIHALRWSYLRPDYNFLCQELSGPEDTSEGDLQVLFCAYAYMVLKFSDYLDTVFFVLRKQSGHVSFLHVYHHALMGLTGYYGVRYIPGGNGAVLVIANTFVHTFMYAYYLLSALESTRDFAQRFKKNITQIQLIQFMCIGSHYAQAYLDSSCKFPKYLSISLTMQNTFMALMFMDFYARTYWRKPKAEALEKERLQNGNA